MAVVLLNTVQILAPKSYFVFTQKNDYFKATIIDCPLPPKKEKQTNNEQKQKQTHNISNKLVVARRGWGLGDE